MTATSGGEPANGFEAFAASLPDHIAPDAYASPALADAYWRAIRAGHTHDGLLGQTRNLAHVDRPVGILVTRLRKLADTPPPKSGRAGSSSKTHHVAGHQPCPDPTHHPDCVLCRCTERTIHHVPVPMPDWFRQQWRDLRMNHVGAMPTDDEQAS